MKRPLTSLVALTLLIFTAARGQTTASTTSQPAPSQQSPEVEEAARLSRTVRELYAASKYAEALPLAERALALSEKASPPDDSASATAYQNLAAILVGLEKFDRARAAYERALALRERRFGSDHDDTNQIREALASALFRSGERSKALQLFEQALASRERSHGTADQSVTRTRARLAYLYLLAGESGKRDAAYSRLLDEVEKSPADIHEEVRTVLSVYVCTGAARPNAGAGIKAIQSRIQRLGEAWRAAKRAARASETAVEGGLLDRRSVSKPAPIYPMEAKQWRVQGTVVLRITVDEEGRVVDALPLCGPSPLYSTCVVAAKQARFPPTLVDGEPVKVTGTITYNFVIK